MKSNITISIATPHVTKERYCELTGIDEDTVKAMLKDGRLSSYRHRLRKDGGRELILINMVALTVDAVSRHELQFSN